MKSPGGCGERMKGCCGSVDTGRSGRALMIAVTSAISVERTSWVKQLFCCKRIESKILLAFMQLDVSIDSISSIWTALELRQLNIMAHRLLSACPPLVPLNTMDQGPEDIKAHVREGRADFKAFRWQISHMLFFQFSTQLPKGCDDPDVSPLHDGVVQAVGRCDCPWLKITGFFS